MPHKHGDALLAGLLRCRRCGRKLTLRYSGVKNHRGTANDCRADLVNEGERFAGNYARLVVWSRGGCAGPQPFRTGRAGVFVGARPAPLDLPRLILLGTD
jgi:hypothetical protein